MDVESKSMSVSSSSEREESFEENLLSHDTYHDVILEYVLNDLHSSAKSSLVHYLEKLVDEEVKEVVDFPQKSNTNEVIV